MKGKAVKQILAWIWVMLPARVLTITLLTTTLLTTTLLVPTAAAQESESISETKMALGYYLPLAEQGEPYAQLTIGEIYMEGAGVEPDLVQAYAWFAVALHQGIEEAETIMNHVFDKLGEADKTQARSVAEQYIQHFSPR